MPKYNPEVKLTGLEQERREVKLRGGHGSDEDLAETLPNRRQEIIDGHRSIGVLKKRFPFIFTQKGVSRIVVHASLSPCQLGVGGGGGKTHSYFSIAGERVEQSLSKLPSLSHNLTHMILVPTSGHARSCH